MFFCTLEGGSRKFILVFPFPFHILLLNYIFPITSFTSTDLCSSNLHLSDHKFYPIHVFFTISQGSLDEHSQKWKPKVENTKENTFIANQCLDYRLIKSSSEPLVLFQAFYVHLKHHSQLLPPHQAHPCCKGPQKAQEVRPGYSGL